MWHIAPNTIAGTLQLLTVLNDYTYLMFRMNNFLVYNVCCSEEK